MKRKIINIPIFNHRVTFIKSDFMSFRKYIKSVYGRFNFSSDSNSDINGLCVLVDGEIYVWFDNDTPIETLGHEIIHAVYMILDSRGIDAEEQETFAYIWEYLMKNSICMLSEQTEVTNPL